MYSWKFCNIHRKTLMLESLFNKVGNTRVLVNIAKLLKRAFYKKKSHTCEEGVAHLRIFFWCLLMDLKNKYLLKNLLKWANKKCNNFNIYRAVFFLKNKEKNPGNIIILHLCTKNIVDMVYNSWDIECDGLKLVILGHVLLFYPPKTLKNQNFEKMKKFTGGIIIFHMCTEN